MRQQFKPERPVETKATLPLVTPETHTAETALQTQQTTTIPPASKWQGWPFLTMGALLIVSAGITFFQYQNFQNSMSVEETLSIDQTIGTNSQSEFLLIFSMLSIQLLVAAIYISYGLWLRKNGASGKLPAFLMFYAKRHGKQSDSDRALSAWLTRLSAVFGLAMGMYFQVTALFYPPGHFHISFYTMVSTANSILLSAGYLGLLLTLADTIYPLRGRRKSE